MSLLPGVSPTDERVEYRPESMTRSHIEWMHRHHHRHHGDRKKTHRGYLLVAASAVAMLLGASTDFTTAGATTGEAAVMPQVADVIAEQYATTPETVAAHLRHIETVRPVLAQWKTVYPEVFAGVIHADGFTQTTNVRFVGSVPAAVQAEAASLEALDRVGDIVFDTTATLSLQELRSGYLRAVALLENAGVREAKISFSVSSGTVKVVVRSDDEVALPSRYSTPDSIKEMLEGNGIGGVAIKAVTGQLVTEASVYGGDELRKSGSSKKCTSGFPVTAGSTEGVLTAEHCVGVNQYVAVNGDDSTHTATRQAGHKGSQGDMAWYSTSGSEEGSIYKDAGWLDNVQGYISRSHIDVGDFFCFYGIVTDDMKCGNVEDAETTVTNNGVEIGNLVQMEGDGLASARGDSGGPWFWNGYSSVQAVGIHHGHTIDGGSYTLYFTPVHTALTHFDLDLLEDD